MTALRHLSRAAVLLTASATMLVAQRLPVTPVAYAPVAAPVLPAPDQPAATGGFERSGFAQFMASPAGRVTRVVAGVGMVVGGIAWRNDGSTTGGTTLAIAGAVPLSAGLFDVCWLSPIFGGPLRGSAIREAGDRK
ncbi:MAG: hypothetical protein MUF00_12790 [Gemmatimonadaceae bacterium]|jgi:hypothetical protein|nr:hypothetical protein [Gemmatimonadaceae bacterium]